MRKGTLTIKSADGRFVIEQESDNEFYVITIYKDNRILFSSTHEEKESYGELAKTLDSYIRMFG